MILLSTEDSFLYTAYYLKIDLVHFLAYIGAFTRGYISLTPSTNLEAYSQQSDPLSSRKTSPRKC